MLADSAQRGIDSRPRGAARQISNWRIESKTDRRFVKHEPRES